ncbi:FadR/GntR family transcriptional regulator [Streptosporangium sp. CA-135522]|uniref:FadR/GntR family transcriptional regulator n=1 Tax=Streptosporangium sp. CA-135522 TaxID=3240072 RepID=UPI003D8AE03E
MTVLLGDEAGDVRPSGEQVLRTLESHLLSGRWAEGTRIPGERALAEELGVSRPIVREALRDLQARGFLSVEPGRGTFVRSARPDSVDLLVREGLVTARHLIVARRMLECQTAALAASFYGPDDAVRMTELLTALKSTDDAASSAVLDVAFHESIAAAAGNPVLKIMFGSIRALVRGVVLRSLTDPVVRAKGVPQHDVILAAILARDPEAARQAMAEHLTIAEEYYGPDLDQPITEILAKRAILFPRLADLLRDAGNEIRRTS